jgi:hypothetical protein
MPDQRESRVETKPALKQKGHGKETKPIYEN